MANRVCKYHTPLNKAPVRDTDEFRAHWHEPKVVSHEIGRARKYFISIPRTVQTHAPQKTTCH